MRTTDPNTLLQQELRQQNGGAGQRTSSQQFTGVYDALIYSVDPGNQTCMVVVPSYGAGQIPLGPTPYFGNAPSVGDTCVVGFVTPLYGSQGEIVIRILTFTGTASADGDSLSPFLLMGA